MIQIAQGAEANLYEDNNMIIKERVSKKYRIPQLDSKLIKSRTKKEAKILIFLKEKNLNVPKILKVEDNRIFMEKIPGTTLKNSLNDNNYIAYMEAVGKLVALMHELDIVHGDLTTLNFLINQEIFIIDFGLSFYSGKNEDKAVDLYVFERAVKCGHKEEYLEPFYKSYSENGSKDVLKKLESVRLRGRKREEEAII